MSRTALARSEVLFRLRRYEEALSTAGPLAEKFAEAELSESAWMAARLAAQAATGLGQTTVTARWQALADAQRARFVAQFDPAALRIIRVETRLEAVMVVRLCAIPHG